MKKLSYLFLIAMIPANVALADDPIRVVDPAMTTPAAQPAPVTPADTNRPPGGAAATTVTTTTVTSTVTTTAPLVPAAVDDTPPVPVKRRHHPLPTGDLRACLALEDSAKIAACAEHPH